MRVLIACEFSGVVRRAFRALGHDAWSCDIEPAEDGGYHHLQCDALTMVTSMRWDLLIAHPPCTYLANSGVRHLHSVPSVNGVVTKVHGAERWTAMCSAAAFFRSLLDCNVPRVCVENPVPHRYARELTGNYSQIVNPWQYGHGETKRTCLWLRNLPHLTPTNIVSGREPRIHHMAPGINRAKERSRTFQGIAEAMATQWGSL